ncbi:MAG TPA: helix-turn-helix domain-containing protein [Yinghuangia sp.]|nr:helix-turn-helix domain-containing protein [Yinghuangia sp.]
MVDEREDATGGSVPMTGQGSMPGVPRESSATLPADLSSALQRAHDLRHMHRLATRTGAEQALVRWLAERTGCWIALLDQHGVVRQVRGADQPAGAAAPDDVLREADVAEMLAQGRSSAVLDVGDRTGVLMSVPVSGDTPVTPTRRVLAAVGARPLPEGMTQLLADAVPLMAIAVAMAEAGQAARHVQAADSRIRESVLHLLMFGEVATARQVAGALGPPLPDSARVHVVECAAPARDRVAALYSEATGGQAWVVRCPVYDQHLVAVVPADTGTGDFARSTTRAIPGIVVAVSDVVALRDTAAGYEQAFHVLPVARENPDRLGSFSPTTELAALVGPSGAIWARRLLDPLLGYVPKRAQDPGQDELVTTVRGWLAFCSGVTRYLRLHRNTVSARLRRVEEILGLDLDHVPHQAALSLALRVHALPHTHAARTRPSADSTGVGSTPSGKSFVHPTLDDVLAGPAVAEWARTQLARVDAFPWGSRTLLTWLEADARLSATARALGISVTGTRKRLTRLETALERSLLHTPSARHDLWLATRSLELAAAAETGGQQPTDLQPPRRTDRAS